MYQVLGNMNGALIYQAEHISKEEAIKIAAKLSSETGHTHIVVETVTFHNTWVMPLSEIVRSSFDHCIAGQIASDGNYYCIYSDHKTHENYAVTREVAYGFDALGRTLEEDEPETEIAGNLVRPMTWGEECEYNEDRLVMLVDQWGNICTDEKANEAYAEWYYEHCI